LADRLSLYDVADVEAFCAGILRRHLKRIGASLSFHRFEDALAFLVSEAWHLSQRFDERAGVEFSGFAARILGQRVTDWYRREFVDQRYDYGDAERRDAIVFAQSFERLVSEGVFDDASVPAGADAVGAGLPAADSGRALHWLYATRARERERDWDHITQHARTRIPSRDSRLRNAGRAARRRPRLLAETLYRFYSWAPPDIADELGVKLETVETWLFGKPASDEEQPEPSAVEPA
jgi:DNA-directed RNA polymerase specialized sigma24 family protein